MPPLSQTGRSALLAWFDSHQRELPWRTQPSAYGTWVSEIMLQQTQVATVIDYWLRWMARFPTVEALANAPVDEVLAQWQGLGYYRRARLLQQGAKAVVARGNLPRTAVEWEDVPGVGRYTAGAIASIAFGEVAPLVDGNVERVYARIAADSATGPSLTRAAWGWASENVDPERPGDWNQALMELGATVCRPVSPQCLFCPLQAECAGLDSGRPEAFPSPKPKAEIVELHHHIWIPAVSGRLGLRRVPEGRWWHGMWEFPREDDADRLAQWLDGPTTALGRFRHTVTRHRITVEVTGVRLAKPIPGLTWVEPEELVAYAVPAPTRRAYQLAESWLVGRVK